MRLIYIVPGPMGRTPEGKAEVARRGKLLREFAAPRTEVDIVDVPRGPASIESMYEEYISIPATAERILEVEEQGYDAAIVGCFGDPGLDAYRELTDMLVVGPGEASFLAAAMLGGCATSSSTPYPYFERLEIVVLAPVLIEETDAMPSTGEAVAAGAAGGALGVLMSGAFMSLLCGPYFAVCFAGTGAATVGGATVGAVLGGSTALSAEDAERVNNYLENLQQTRNLSEELAKAQSPEQLHREEMDSLLKRRVETDTRLGEARARLQGLENDYREKDAQRQQAIQASDEIRQDLERARLQQQEIQLNARALQRQVDELGGDVNQLAAELPDDLAGQDWEAELERLRENIARLEPVNLAAIQEFEEEQKRKDYLDAQNADLCDALNTLENAIAKIDRKTRTRFKETFERVNKGVQELFPRLFGGGHAYLELTGEDLLTTGVTIMAQPPGKRVTSLHLLSGGEKALTAVSFVFAIFRLNPAPFCLLDEVDAPLDDANVVRFSSMVREMSDTVQFIVVTHNKITMEMAHQMSGVTMREPGVSRLVQVDIEEAAALAAN